MGKKIMRTGFNKRAFIPVVFLLCTMIAIFCFSSQDGNDSNGLSQKVSRLFCRIVFTGFDELEADQQLFVISGINRVVRKAAHFSVYAVLGICAYTFFYCVGIKRKYLPAVILCALYAVLDEVHQSFTPGRSIKLTDMLIDTSGAVFGAAFTAAAIIVIIHIKEEKSHKRASGE